MSPPDLSQRLSTLSREEKARLFEKLRASKGGNERISRRPAGSGPAPLSFAQLRLWFLNRLQPGDPSYNIAKPVLIRGELAPAELGRALAAVVARHEALRTTIEPHGAEPVQVVDPEVRVSLPVVDLTGLGLALPEDDTVPTGELARLAEEDAFRPFDLARGPLLRAAVLRIAPDCSVLLLTVHHIVADGWSSGILSQEMGAFYQAFLTGIPADLPALPIQYADFAVWQRAHLTGATLAAHLDYWRQELAGVPGTLDLPYDRPRPEIQTTAGRQLRFSLSRAASESLRRLALITGGTPFVVLLAGFFALLGRFSGQEDLTVGTAVANRQRREVEGLIGFFVNTLVLRGRLGGDPTFGELAERARRTAMGAYSHQDLPFEKLVEEIQPLRDTGRSPLFQVMLVLQNTPSDSAAGSSADSGLGSLRSEEKVSKFDLSVTFREKADGFRGSLMWNLDLFDPTTTQRMADGFVRLIEAAVAAPTLRLSGLPLLSAAEEAECLAAGRGRALGADLPSLAAAVAVQAAQTPDAVAASMAGNPRGLEGGEDPREGEWSYGALQGLVEAWADGLVALGVGPERVVGVALDRSLELVAAMLAVWTAGGVYLPLDPTYPADRLAYMLADSGAALVLTSSAWAGMVPEGVRTVRIEDLPRAPGAAARPAPAPGSLAYLIYTSGSTGRPKGVMVPHGSLAVLTAKVLSFGAGPGCRVLLFFSPSFDGSIVDLATPLVSGGTLVVAPREALLPGRELAGLLAAHRVTHLKIPPTALAVLPAGDYADLADVGVAGEAVSAELAARWGRGRRLWNLYGPTEAAVFVTVADIAGGRSITLGDIVPGDEVHVLDRHGRPVPPGVPGELCLGGALARGYHGRPELTALRFVPHPFPADAVRGGERLYRSGDLGRRTAAGALEFLGRADDQVKVRGYRIEPAEIEAVLGEHPGVAQAAVVVLPGAGGKVLAAFLVAAAERPEAEELRRHLRRRLPEYMIPASFTFLDALPRTPSGKVDRRELEASTAPRARESARVPPRTALQAEIAAIWAAVLGMPEVGIEDNFFDLGGHSILLTLVQTQLAERFSWEIPLLALFEHPTVGALATYLEQRGKGGGGEPAAPAEESRERASRQRQGLELQQKRRMDRRVP